MVNLFVAYCQFKVSNLIDQEYKTTADDACIPIKSESKDHKNIEASSPKTSSMNNIRLYIIINHSDVQKCFQQMLISKPKSVNIQLLMMNLNKQIQRMHEGSQAKYCVCNISPWSCF